MLSSIRRVSFGLVFAGTVGTLTACSGGTATLTTPKATNAPIFASTTAPQVNPTVGALLVTPAPTASPVGATPAPKASATPAGAAVAPCTDCWPMFMGNAARTGLQASSTGITTTTAPNLALRWSYLIGEETAGSPISANGVLYVTSGGGTVLAFDERTGTPIWKRSLGAAITMTPTYDSGIIFVSTHNPPAQVFALDATSGATRWQTSFPGAERGEPVAIGGIVYIPEAGGDPGECHQGGVHAFSELTGQPVWTWYIDANSNDGGSVWAPLSYDGRKLVFGTGNACSLNVVNANSVVQLSLAGDQDWRIPQQVGSYVDDDFGGGAMILGNAIIIMNKNGKLYSLDDRTGTINWATVMTSIDEEGSIGSPSSDGTTIVAPSGFATDPRGTASGFVGGYDLAGNLLWKVATDDYVPGGAAITNGVAFVSIDDTVVGIDMANGQKVWTFTSPENGYYYASPAVDSTGVYAVDSFGGVFAFGLASSATAANRAAPQSVPAPTLHEPYGPIFRRTATGLVRAASYRDWDKR